MPPDDVDIGYIVQDFFDFLYKSIGLKDVLKGTLPVVSLYTVWKVGELKNQYYSLRRRLQEREPRSHLDELTYKIEHAVRWTPIDAFAFYFYYNAYEFIQQQNYFAAAVNIVIGVSTTVLVDNLPVLYSYHIWEEKLEEIKTTYYGNTGDKVSYN